MSTLSKINLNGTQYDIKEKLSSEYTSYNIAYEPLPGDYVETAISKLHKVILDNEQVVSSSLIDLNEKIETVQFPVTSVNGQTGAVTLTLGDTNVIETVKVNGTALTPDGNKTVNITIPEGQLSSNYATSTLTNDDLGLAYGDTYEEAFGKLEKAILDNEFVVTNAIADLDARILDTESLATVAKSGNYNDLTNRPTIPTKTSDLTNNSGFLTSYTETDPTVASYIKSITQSDITNWNSKTSNTGTITGITMNGASKGTSGVVDLGTVITDISGKADTSAAIGSLSLSMNSSTYVITLSGAKVDGTTFTVNDSIDLPLESVVVDGEYNSTTKKVVLTLKSGSTVEFSIADLINGLQSEITSTNKLSADLISDGTTNKTVTQTEKNTWNSKLDSFTETDPTVASYIKSITQSDITNWNSKTSNVGTITGITMNGTSKGTSGVVNLGTVVVSETDPTVASYIKAITQSDITNWNNKLDSFTETDPIFSASTAATITSTDITNWNSKTSNVGTITGITMNGTSKGTSGVVNLGTVVVSETDPTVASYIKAITQSDITNWNNKLSTAPVTSVNGQTGAVNLTIPTVSDSTVTITMNGNTVGTFTLNKSGNTTIDLGTVLTSHQSIKTVNSQSLTGTGNISINELPTVTSSDNGKVLMVANGAWALVNPVTLYSGSGTPPNSQGNNGDLYVQS